MTRVTKVIGAPGAGKSHTTREKLTEALADGVSPDETCFSSFTRAAVADIREGIEEAVEEDGLPLEFADGVSVETFNALCLRAAVLDGFEAEELISMDSKSDEEYFKQFFSDVLPQFSFSTPTPEEYEYSTSGAKMLAVYNLLHARGCRTIEEFMQDSAGMDYGCQTPEFEAFVLAWETWKKDTGYRQHGDYIAYVRDQDLLPVPLDDDVSYRVLVVDEFQDLNPLQYAVYKQWRDSGEFDHIFVAGDAAQSVYGFRGANPAYLVRTDADETIELVESYRCAPEVIEYADRMISGQGYFEAKLSSARSDGETGEVDKEYRVRTLAELTRKARACVENEGSTFILARRNKDVGKIAKALNKAGVPYLSVSPAAAEKHEGLWYWAEPLPTLRLLLKKWRVGRKLSKNEVQTYLQNTTLRTPATKRLVYGLDEALKAVDAPLPDGHGMLPADVMRLVTGGCDVSQAIDALNFPDARREALRNALRNDVNTLPEKLRIGTIHSAKGLEADCVLLMGYVSDSRFSKLKRGGHDLREEQRVYFVGATRARDNLYMVTGLFGSKRSPALPR